jgi:2-polyprenyl-3-methyl-5-hydroxy-6-metoxy-1,4-benzoquinol methylase
MAPWRGANVLELGSGTGVAGLAAAAEGADVLLTDKELLVPLLSKNIRLNQDQVEIGSVQCEAFDWAAPPPAEVSTTTWDVVLGADLVSTFADVVLFADALASLIGPRGVAAGATSIYAHSRRSLEIDMELQKAFTARGLVWTEMPSPMLSQDHLSTGGSDDRPLDEVVLWEVRSDAT